MPGASTTIGITTPGVSDAETTEIGNPRVILPTGSPPRPSVTATCRPRTWMQQIAEGRLMNLPEKVMI